MFGKEEALFAVDSYDIGTRIASGWDVARDGQRFLVLFREGGSASVEVNHVTLVSDFAEDLKRLAPVGGK